MKRIIGSLIFLGLALIALGLYNQKYLFIQHANPVHTNTIAKPGKKISSTEFFYQGENGKDALTLLKEKAIVEQDNSGMVVSINGRKADNNKREYWAFYVNGKLAQVGSADYQTKNTDELVWKIQTY